MHGSAIRRAALLGVLSIVVLAAQVSLTRLFSVIFLYHFGFLILSTALLGFGVGGLVIRAFRERLARADADRLVGFGVVLSGPLLALSLNVVTHNTFRPMAVHQSGAEALRLGIVTLALLPAFVVMGATVLFMLQRWSESVDALYGANLIGSGLGCLVAIALLDAVGGRTAFVALAGTLPFVGAWYLRSGSNRDAWAAAALGAAVFGSLGFADSLYPMDTAFKPIACQDAESNVFSDWTSLSKVDVCPHAERPELGLWGLSSRNQAPLPKRLGVSIDYWAYTTILEHDDRPGYYDFIDALPMYVAHEWKEAPSVLTIGAGGGMDIRAALEKGASEVDAVEINPSIFRAMKEDLAEYSGHIYDHPRVRSHLAEGRRFVESSERGWDVIQISGVDTHTATQAGAFALSENFLYTTEAMQTYFDHLEEDGVLTLTRWFFPTEGRPRFSLRLFSLVLEGLERYGIEDPARHILFFRSAQFTVILVKLTPIRAEEIAKVEEHASRYGYRFLFRPDETVPDSDVFYDFIASPDRQAWMADYRYDVSPPSDDRPFFFEHRKLRDIYKAERFIAFEGLDGQMILALLLVEMLVAGVVLLALSYRIDRSRARPLGWLYFASIGLGFMLVEVTLSQRLVLFLGHPVYALSVVLFTILVSSGIGAALSSRLAKRVPAPALLLGVAGMMVLWAFLGTPLLRALISFPTPIRMGVAVLLIAPAGVLMGTAFPEAVRRFREAGEDELGVYWAWNGVASVTASVLAVIVAMANGFATVMLLAAVCYATAAAVLPRLAPTHR